MRRKPHERQSYLLALGRAILRAPARALMGYARAMIIVAEIIGGIMLFAALVNLARTKP